MRRWTSSIASIAVLLVLASPAAAEQIDPDGDYDAHIELILDTSSRFIKAGRVSITKVLALQERRLPDVDLSIRVIKATYVLTCIHMEVCKKSEWVADGTHLTVEAGDPRSFGTKKHTALTWAEAQQELAEYARRRFRPDLQRALQKMADFKKKCAEGG